MLARPDRACELDRDDLPTQTYVEDCDDQFPT
jgi:hypothetical protein